MTTPYFGLRKTAPSVRAILCAIAASTFISGCETPKSADWPESSVIGQSNGVMRDLTSTLPKDVQRTLWQREAEMGFEALRSNELQRASLHFNRALKMNVTNSYLQFLNGLTYHLLGKQAGHKNLELAQQGYQLAVRFDPGNWIAYFYDGLLMMELGEYRAAQSRLADAALYKSEDPEIWYALAAASYYAHDPVRAAGALQKARNLQKGAQLGPRLLRASAITMAALNESEAAKSFVALYRTGEQDGRRQQDLVSRVENWRSFYLRNSDLLRNVSLQLSKGPQLAQMPGGMPDAPPGGGMGMGGMPEQPAAPPPDTASAPPQGVPGAPGADTGFVQKDMVVVDVTIIRTEEDINESRGVNLLNGLRLQFGNPTQGQPGFSYGESRVYGNPTLEATSHTITKLVQIPSVTYSLNIANSQFERNEVLARPSIVALGGKPSEFFAGLEVSAAAVSGGQGDSIKIEKQVGVKLQVTPEFLPGGLVRLAVKAERTFLTNPSKSVVFDFRLDTSKTSVSANVVMRYGETLILSGLSESENEHNRDGVPVLEDIPIVQYMFAQKRRREFQKSVLILLTPRRTQYVNRPAPGPGETLSKGDDVSITELTKRFGELFKPHSNLFNIFQHLQTNRMFREYRTGDYSIDGWSQTQTHQQRLEKAFRSLYF